MPDLSPVTAAAPTAALAAVSGETASRAYFDHLASTPCDPEAAELMARLAVELAANASSSHAAGRRAAQVVEEAREQVAAVIDALPEEIAFTSGATESNNLAILGVAASALADSRPRRRVLTLGIEHPSVLEPVAELGRRGFDVEFVPVAPDGRVSLSALEEQLEGALLLSIQAANNEIGTLQPLVEASCMAADRGVLVHSDAAQIVGKLPFSVEEGRLDFASISAHKCYGPKGVGALWIRGGSTRAPIRPITFGGGHEGGLRPGTYNAPAIAAFGLAVSRARDRLAADAARIGGLRDRFEQELLARLPGLRVNGALNHRVPGATSITFEGIDADALVANLPDFDLSTASACHAGAPEPSHVLRAIGLSHDEAYATLRVGLGRGITEQQVGRLAVRLVEVVGRLRQPARTRESLS